MSLPEEGVCVQLPYRDRETLRELLPRRKLRVEQVLPVTVHVLPVVRGFAEQESRSNVSNEVKWY